MRDPTKERFIIKVARFVGEAGCWLWVGARHISGYGAFKWPNSGMIGAHRASYLLFIGPIPEGLSVCHKCDVRLCVNPAHLFLGTNAENLADMREKGRQAKGETHGARLHPERLARGESNGQSKLTEQQVIEIRAITGVTQREIADRFGISQSHVHRIRKGLQWSQIT